MSESQTIEFVLARMSDETAGELHLMGLVLFHGLLEACTSDHDDVNRKYVPEDLGKVLNDATLESPNCNEIATYIHEFGAGETTEARLAKDADQLE